MKEKSKMDILELKETYNLKKDQIVKRLKEFEDLWKNSSDEEIFAEMSFCLLTPQSRAKICWAAILKLKSKNLLFSDNSDLIEKELSGVRFKDKKAIYIINAKKFFKYDGQIVIKRLIEQFDDVYKLREWLVTNIKGYGYKESSHFLRNIGFGEKLTILDRHILKNLEIMGIIDQSPTSLSKSKYMEIEEKMKDFAVETDIPVSHLDLLFWSKETGEIFK